MYHLALTPIDYNEKIQMSLEDDDSKINNYLLKTPDVIESFKEPPRNTSNQTMVGRATTHMKPISYHEQHHNISSPKPPPRNVTNYWLNPFYLTPELQYSYYHEDDYVPPKIYYQEKPKDEKKIRRKIKKLLKKDKEIDNSMWYNIIIILLILILGFFIYKSK